MASPSPGAGGAFLALGAIGGTVIGLFLGQVTLGFLAGLGLGLVASLAIWWRGRR